MAKGKVEFAGELCKGCSLCLGVCPKKILRLGEKTNKKGYNVVECTDMSQCTGCTACAVMCPDLVISVYRD
ncbi:MAG: 4Fe-4S dicluster domain-containing protein [Firmicutes bacterium]|nr:4Fe-4S dicluster domain-containing protein [Bacillota bacterium]